MRAVVAALFALLLSSVASLAQSTVSVIGPVTPGHCVGFFSTTQIQDTGSVCAASGGVMGPGSSTVGDLAVWNNTTGNAIADTGLSFPGGFSFAGTLTGATAVTFPTSGTLATTATANVASVTGTAGQITATPTTGAVVVGLPGTITANITVSGTINNTGTFQVGGNTMTFPATAQTLAGLGTAQTWTAVQTFTNSDIALLGSSTGKTTFTSANAGASNFTVTVPAVTDTIAMLGTPDQVLSGGANVTPANLGIVSSGTTTIDCGASPLQWMVDNGASTIAAPALDGSCVVEVINGASAGALTMSGFAKAPAGFATTPTSTATVTFTNASANIGWVIAGLALNAPVFFTNSGGALPTNFVSGTIYYVKTSSGTVVTVCSTPTAGSCTAIVAGSAGTGTQTGTQPSVWDLSLTRINGTTLGMWAQAQ